MIKAPCRDCETRAAGCHSTCERYKEYKSKVDTAREKKQQADGLKSAIIGCSIKRAHTRVR